MLLYVQHVLKDDYVHLQEVRQNEQQLCKIMDIYNLCDTRPLSGASTDAKLFAMCIADRINSVIGDWAIYLHRGFIRGRLMLKNVLQI